MKTGILNWKTGEIELGDSIECFKYHQERPLSRIIGRNYYKDWSVSTVFLMLAHGLYDDDWFETLVESNSLEEGDIYRYKTLEEAKQGHIDILMKVINGTYGKED